MPRRKPAAKIADGILADQAEHLERKWKAFQAGDPTSALTDLEQEFLLKLKKLYQDEGLLEAQTKYLENLKTGDLELFYEKLEASLPPPEAND